VFSEGDPVTSRRPLIGLTTFAEQARFGRVDMVSGALPMTYVRAVHATGARAVLITPDDPGTDVLDALDALVLTGGGDLDPANWGGARHPASEVDPGRDRAELMLTRAALAADLPVLGICRGMQVLAVAAGGTLHQHLPDLVGHHRHRPVSGSFGRHDIVTAAGSRAHELLGPRVAVNSFHHQAVADPGECVVTGWCPDDRVTEVIEHPGRAFAMGVQWHPERTADLRVLAALTAAARHGAEKAGSR
jgi:putative glutamine amidotransferase